METSWRVLPRDRLISFGGRGGLRRVELIERVRTGSFSIGGGGIGDPGESRLIPSGNFGTSGRINWASLFLAGINLEIETVTYEWVCYAFLDVLDFGEYRLASQAHLRQLPSRALLYGPTDC